MIISTSTFVEYTKITILDNFIQNYFFSLIFSSFCILILINGCNFIDGVNNLLIGYFLIISGCILYKFNSGEIIFNEINFEIIIMSLIILIIFNFLSIIIMGDSGAYVMGLFFGFFPSATCRAPPPDPLAKRTAHCEPCAVGHLHLVKEISHTNRAPWTAATAHRSALRVPPPPVRAPRFARRGLGSPAQLRLKPAKKPPIFEHDPRAARAGGQRL